MSPSTAGAEAFGIEALPYGVVEPTGAPPRVAVAIGDHALDLAAVATAGLLDNPDWFARPSLNRFLEQGPAGWSATRSRVRELLSDPAYTDRVAPYLLPREGLALRLPFEVADYVDFYSSRHHAENSGRILRPANPGLPPNWLHLPVGYHGRAGTVVVSGTPIQRPWGQRPESGYAPTERLDIEAEVGFVVGVGTTAGTRVTPDELTHHVFGVVLVNDWSARDIQAWEGQPLGPFLGKSFATSISPWVLPLEALAAVRVPPPVQDPPPLPYLVDDDPWALDLRLEVRVNGHLVSRPPFAAMYWTPGQQLAHLTSNGATLRPGDLFASGTVSGPEPDQVGSLMELTVNGAQPVDLPDGRRLGYLVDYDTVTISAWAPLPDGGRLGLGSVTGQVTPASSVTGQVTPASSVTGQVTPAAPDGSGPARAVPAKGGPAQ